MRRPNKMKIRNQRRELHIEKIQEFIEVSSSDQMQMLLFEQEIEELYPDFPEIEIIKKGPYKDTLMYICIVRKR